MHLICPCYIIPLLRLYWKVPLQRAKNASRFNVTNDIWQVLNTEWGLTCYSLIALQHHKDFLAQQLRIEA